MISQHHASEALRATEAECAEGRFAPRVSLDDIENNIHYVGYSLGSRILFPGVSAEGFAYDSTDTLTVCIVVLKNGFSVIGKSAPASRENFDAELGRKLAYEDAVRQIWPLMGYALKQRKFEERAEFLKETQPGIFPLGTNQASPEPVNTMDSPWDREMRRKCALECAVATHSEHEAPGEVVDRAKSFEKYLREGTEPVQQGYGAQTSGLASADLSGKQQAKVSSQANTAQSHRV